MIPKTRNILIFSAVVVLLIGAFGYGWFKKKTTQAITIFKNIRIKPVGISNFKFTWSFITFNMDVDLFNPTNESLSIESFGLASLTRITLYYGDIYLGESLVNQQVFSINENSSTILKNIPITINTTNLLDVIPEFINGKPQLSKFRANATITALGEDYAIQTL